MKLYKPSGQALIEQIIIAWLIVSSLLLFLDIPKVIKKHLLAQHWQVESYLTKPINDKTIDSSVKIGGKQHAKQP
ncbi:MAG TPA: hypothetical protein PKC21_00390 [Oligoflexia bacterium]|nr:hypothetical protein [Oligoflexia bacterium]HMR23785.1 hypothetical protein [Oligoflexia bacterium]